MEKQIPINNEFVELLKRPSAQNAFKKAYELANESGVTLPRINLVNGQMLTEKGNPVKRDEIEVEVYQIKWRWWWSSSHDNLSRYTSSTHQKSYKTVEIATF